MEFDYYRVISRGLTDDPWFYNIIRLAIVQNIEYKLKDENWSFLKLNKKRESKLV